MDEVPPLGQVVIRTIIGTAVWGVTVWLTGDHNLSLATGIIVGLCIS